MGIARWGSEVGFKRWGKRGGHIEVGIAKWGL